MSSANVIVMVLALCASATKAMDNTTTTTTSTTALTVYTTFTLTKIRLTSTSTAQDHSGTGQCVGNDSRCSGVDQLSCRALSRNGAHCNWEADESDSSFEGGCAGNDSRCSGSNQAACARLAARGSDCWWEHADGPEGSCLGNDSRCAGSSNQRCDRFSQEGADCKWRAAFTFTGSMVLEVDNPTSFVNDPDVQDAVISSVMNITSMPEEFLTIDLEVVPAKRSKNRFLSTSGKVVLTYAGSVQGDAQPTPTGKEVADALLSTTADDFTKTLSSTIEAIADSAFVLNVVEKSDVSLTVLESSSTSTSTSTVYSHSLESSSTSMSTSTIYPHPQTTLTEGQALTTSASTSIDDSHVTSTVTQGQTSTTPTATKGQTSTPSASLSTGSTTSPLASTTLSYSLGSNESTITTSSTLRRTSQESSTTFAMEPPDTDVAAKLTVASAAQCFVLSLIVLVL